MSDLRITAVRAILCQPNTARLVVVRVETNQPGLTGLGCATFTQRHRAVQAAIEHHIGPFMIGKDPCRIEDLWQSAMVNGYWRNGPVLNNAISGVDMALWDILGKRTGVPCHDLWGGRCREAAAVYVHANGSTREEVLERAQAFIAQGIRHVRCQYNDYDGIALARSPSPEGAQPGSYFDARDKLRSIPALFAYLRRELGDTVELMHDVHERLAPIDAVWLAKALEEYRLFFLEDLLAPEDIDWYRTIRAQCATPLAMGELFNHPREYVPIVAERLIDFMRVHISQIGGITPALKLIHLCDPFGVRTAWHGPLDTSPVGMMAALHLDVSCRNFGIQEWMWRNQAEYDLFPGLAEIRQGYVYPNAKPGLGIEMDEALAARFPCTEGNPTWSVTRLPDGTLVRP